MDNIEQNIREIASRYKWAINEKNLPKIANAKHQKQDHQELWDIKFVKDGGTTEIVDTYASEEACQQELAYYRSKPGIGVRYFMEKSQ